MTFTEQAITETTVARERFVRSAGLLTEQMSGFRPADWMIPLPAGPVMGGLPRSGIISAMVDHTAHHRGALTVYARLQGITPPDPFGM